MSLVIDATKTPCWIATLDAKFAAKVSAELVALGHSFYAEPEPDDKWSFWINASEKFLLDRAIFNATAP